MRAIITGSSHGIGLEMAKICRAKGMEVWITGMYVENLKEQAEELGAHAFLAADLSANAGQEEFLEWVGPEPIDLFVNNAGYGIWKDVVDTEPESMETMIRLNVVALTRFSREMAIRMKVQGYGRILNVASTAAFLPGPHMAAYYASKAYVLSFSDSLSFELRGSGVTLTTLCPGPTRSGFFKRAGMVSMPLLDGPWMPIMSAQKVAAAGLNAALRGKRRSVPGIMNYLSSKAPIFMPRYIQLGMLNWLQGTKQS